MADLLRDFGWDGMTGSVEGCDECETSTIHLAAPGGVSVCSECGYNPLFDLITDDEALGAESGSNILYLADYR